MSVLGLAERDLGLLPILGFSVSAIVVVIVSSLYEELGSRCMSSNFCSRSGLAAMFRFEFRIELVRLLKLLWPLTLNFMG